jgi:hypothetical protein
LGFSVRSLENGTEGLYIELMEGDLGQTN